MSPVSNAPRRRTRSTAAAAACLLLAALTAESGADADANGPGSDPIEILTVTAPRVEKPLVEVPAAVSRVDRRAIQLGRRQLTLEESLKRVPGLFVQNRSNFAQDLRIAIRGFGARANFGIRGIRLIVDGIPATLPDGQAQVDNIDLGSAERIEVIRGPSSSLYGASAGGVILIESESGLGEPYVEGRAAVGEHGYRKYQTKAGGALGRFDYLVSVSRLEMEGYRQHSRTENVLLNSRFGLRFDETTSVGVVVNSVHAPIADDPGALRAAEVEQDRRQAAPNNLLFDAGESVDQQQLGIRFRKEFGTAHEVEIVNHYVWREFDNRVPVPGGDRGRIDLERFFTGAGLRYVYTDGLFGHDNRLMVGLEIDAQRDVRKRYDNEEGFRGELRLDQDEKVTAFGVYAQDEFRVLDHLELTLGIRYDRVEFDVDDGFPEDGNDGGSLAFGEFSPRLGLAWSPAPAFNVFANVSTSFETPTTTELADPSGAGGFNSDLDAQTSISYELGVKGILPGRVRYEVVGFTTDVEHELVPFEIGGREFFENSGKSKRSGLELGLATQPCEGLTASLAYTFSHFEFNRFRTSAGSFGGNDIPGIPRNQVWAEIAYNHALGFYGSWEIFFADDIYADNANSVQSDDYVVSHLRAGYRGRFGRWELGAFVGVDNLFDEKFSDNVRLNAESGRFFEPAPGRSIYGGVSLGHRFAGP